MKKIPVFCNISDAYIKAQRSTPAVASARAVQVFFLNLAGLAVPNTLILGNKANTHLSRSLT
jgi:hypothetical protein